MVALNVRCYGSCCSSRQIGEFQAADLSGPSFISLLFHPGSGGGDREWVRQNGQAAREQEKGVSLGAPWFQPLRTHSPWPEALAPCSDHMGPFPWPASVWKGHLGLLGRPSAGWLMELLPSRPSWGRAKKEMGMFLGFRVPLGPRGRLRQAPLAGKVLTNSR